MALPESIAAGSAGHLGDHEEIHQILNAVDIGSELTYNEFTSNVTVTATTEAGANTVVTATAFTSDATPVIIEFFAPSVLLFAGTAGAINCVLFEDGSPIGVLAYAENSAADAFQLPVLGRRRLTPTAASHTYSIRAHRNGGNGTIAAGAGGAGAYVPGYIRITKA